jgi:hypothetical protein
LSSFFCASSARGLGHGHGRTHQIHFVNCDVRMKEGSNLASLHVRCFLTLFPIQHLVRIIKLLRSTTPAKQRTQWFNFKFDILTSLPHSNNPAIFLVFYDAI